MTLVPVNNPPAPTQDGVGPAIPDPAKCAEIKAEFGIDTDTYSNHLKRPQTGFQSHHIFQNKAAEGLIGKYSAICIFLAGGSAVPGSEHKIANDAQNDRMYNKTRGGTTPASNFGELKKFSKDDLSKALAGKRTNKKGQPMTKEEADFAADCVVAEAEKAAKDAADDKGGPPLTDATTAGISKPGGCLARGTPVWLAGGDLVAVEDVRPGDWVQTTSGPQVVARIDGCHHDLVEVDLGGEVLTIASFHRVLLADGERRRADELRAGDRLKAIGGTRAVADMRVVGPRLEPVYRIGCRGQVVCAIGRAGIWTVMPEAGPHVDRQESVVPFVAQEEQPCLS